MGEDSKVKYSTKFDRSSEYKKLFKDISYNDFLPSINSKIKKFDILSFDVETYNNNQSFLVGCVFDGLNYRLFYSSDEMKDYLIHRKHPNTLIVATNLQFDFSSIVPREEFHLYNIINKNGRFMMCSYSFKDDEGNNGYRNRFVDSLNHYLGSVESAGKLLNLPKLEPPDWLGKRKPLNDKEWSEIIEYNKRDTEVTYKLMEFLQDSYNALGCEMKMTISSTALDLYRRKYLPLTLFKESFVLKDDNVNKIVFDSYYGGRTEVFRRGLIKDVKLYDINSLYPYCMTMEYPLPQSVKKPLSFSVDNIVAFEGVSDVEVEVGYMFYPLLPYRDEVTHKLIFPVGKWRGSYTHLELRKALELGYKVNKIHSQIIYTKTFHPFKEFIEDLYAKRLEYQRTGSSMQLVTKLLMNSLYGKLAQRDFVEQLWFNIDEMDENELKIWYQSNNSESVNNIGYYRNVKECNSNFIYPILPSYVTSYGRLIIYDYITKYNACYCDTDSIITSEDLPVSNLLGRMKLEQELKEVTIIRPKMYMKKDLMDNIKVKIKGIPRANYNTFEDIINGKKAKYIKFIKVNESIKHNLKVNAVVDVEKNVSLEDNKRLWLRGFNPLIEDSNSSPHVINDTVKRVKKVIYRKSVYEKMLKAQQEFDKIKQKSMDEFVNSDLFDSSMVGQDISNEEFVKNEIWFERNM